MGVPLPGTEFAVKPLSGDTLQITLPHFLKPDCVKNLIKIHRRALRRCRYLVIDVRGNGGGNSGEYNCIKRYCFPKGRSRYPSDADETNYTKRNCDLKVDLLQEMGWPEKTGRYKENRGKGFVAETGGLSHRKRPRPSEKGADPD